MFSSLYCISYIIHNYTLCIQSLPSYTGPPFPSTYPQVPLTIVYKAKHLRLKWMLPEQSTAPPRFSYTTTDSGWMTTVAFTAWFRDVFLPAVPSADSRQGRYILLLLDGHASHLGEEFVSLARQHLVHVVLLPPHTSHLLQPLDVGVFAKVRLLQALRGACGQEFLTLDFNYYAQA